MNLALLLETAAAIHPERTAVTDSEESLTYRGLQDQASSWGAWLAEVADGDPVVYVGVTRVAFVELVFGCAYAGSPLVPVNYRVKNTELESFFDTVRPVVVVSEDRYREQVEAASAGSSTQPMIVGPRSELPDRSQKAPLDPALAALCLFTSGTTSSPKLAVLTHGNLTEYVVNTVNAGSSDPDEAIIVSTPPYHIACVANVLSNVFRGRRLVLFGQFDAVEWLDIVRTECVTHAMVVPTMLARILDAVRDHHELESTKLTSLAYGGSRAPPELVERAIRELPERVGLINAYGLTETSSTVTVLGPEDHRVAFASGEPAVRARLRSVGKPVPGVEIKILRADGSQAATGKEGEICISGPQVSSGYSTGDSHVDAQGWLHTSDIGYLDEAGYLFVSRRQNDVIIRGAEKIHPAEIEEVLEAHPSVQEAMVVGVPDPEWGEVIAALVVADDAVNEADLRGWVRGRLAGYKVPVRLEWVDELPRNELGKIVRRDAVAILEVPA